MNGESYWKLKLAALLHDPPEKALVLMKDPAGHEGGTVAWMAEQLKLELNSEDEKVVRTADRWASAADRPQFPRATGDGPYEPWTQVDFSRAPVFIHPLSGQQHRIGESLSEIPWEWVRDVSGRHMTRLIHRNGSGEVDHRRTFLALWRMAPLPPDAPGHELGELWSLLPADTRVPDHSIWEHARLTSAFAGALGEGGTPSLFLATIGPVQSWIAQARSTSDLWAGSHFLSRMSWEAMKQVCDRCGPDAVLLPNLHGVPLVDAWLEEQGVTVTGSSDWKRLRSDANPLFTAALPNRFIALVPSASAASLAEGIEARLRRWVREQVDRAVDLLLDKSGAGRENIRHIVEQVENQLTGFPEFHWCAVPWPAGPQDAAGATEALREALARFYSDGSTSFFDTPAWKLLSRDLHAAGACFYRPNPGVLYPALYDLADHLLSAGKALRPFPQAVNRGYRCSLCGEREWLTDDPSLLVEPPGKRSGSIWGRLGEIAPSLAKRGEHLCALCCLKRFWPQLFLREIDRFVEGVHRYTVSTHTMALAAGIGRSLETDPDHKAWSTLSDISRAFGPDLWEAALPRSLCKDLAGHPHEVLVRTLPTLMDRVRESEDPVAARKLEKAFEDLSGTRPEAYYALLLMDGDRMGAWLNGTGEGVGTRYRESWHPEILSSLSAKGLDEGPLRAYLDSRRPASPSWHNAISTSLNHFALEIAPWVIEGLFKGKVLYAGGDDLLALLSIDDLLPAMETLRCAYSGTEPHPAVRRTWPDTSRTVRMKDGYLYLKDRLFRTMGEKATTSIGVVVAHHTAPLGTVLRNLRSAERKAKGAGRNAFCLVLQKRSGGWTDFTTSWMHEEEGKTKPTIPLLVQLRDAFAKGVSRRASYHIQSWFDGMPADAETGMLSAVMAYQFRRQRKDKSKEHPPFDPRELAGAVAGLAGGEADRPGFLSRVLGVCEFLAREGRQ